MQKVNSFTITMALFAIACSFAACKKDVGSGTGGPASVNTGINISAGNGQTVTIKGANLLAGGQAPVVMLNNRKLSVVSSSNDSVKVLIPKMAGSGKITVNIGGKSYDGPYCNYQYSVVVTTIAGTGSVGANDGPGSSATFYCPWGITADLNGDLYIADCYNRLIRKISAATNTVSTISIPVTIGGNNFYSPYNITLDQNKHDLYVTDFNLHLLKIAADGSESVIYTGVMPTTGIALGPDGDLYMTNNTTGTLLKLTTSGDSLARYTPGFYTPRNIVFDHIGNMFVAGYDASSAEAAIFKVDNTGNGTIVARDKAFGGWEIAVDTLGNFYEADHFNNVIKLIDPSGNIVTLAGNGTAADIDGIGTNASFDGPEGLAIDSQGNLYVTTFNYTNNSGNKVRKIVIQ
jgi:hypothetical protein